VDVRHDRHLNPGSFHLEPSAMPIELYRYLCRLNLSFDLKILYCADDWNFQIRSKFKKVESPKMVDELGRISFTSRWSCECSTREGKAWHYWIRIVCAWAVFAHRMYINQINLSTVPSHVFNWGKTNTCSVDTGNIKIWGLRGNWVPNQKVDVEWKYFMMAICGYHYIAVSLRPTIKQRARMKP